MRDGARDHARTPLTPPPHAVVLTHDGGGRGKGDVVMKKRGSVLRVLKEKISGDRVPYEAPGNLQGAI